MRDFIQLCDSNMNNNILGFSRCLNSQSSKQVEKQIKKHKILTALPEILPYPQSESHGYSFRRELVCHLTRMKLRLRVAIKRSTLIGSFIWGIETPFQLTTLNVMGASCDLFDVSMDI